MKISASTQTIEENNERMVSDINHKLTKEIRKIIYKRETTPKTIYSLKSIIPHKHFTRNEYHNYKALGSSFQVLNNEKNENSSIYNNNLDIFDNNISLAYNHSLNSKTNDNSIIQKNNIFHNKGKTYESNKNIMHNKMKHNSQHLSLNSNNQKINSLSLPELITISPNKDIKLFGGNGKMNENDSNENNNEPFKTVKNLIYYKIQRSQEQNTSNFNNKKLNANFKEKIHKNRKLHSVDMNLNIEDNMLQKRNDGILRGVKISNNYFSSKQNYTNNEGNKEVIVFQPGFYSLHSSRRYNSNGKVLIYKVFNKNTNAYKSSTHKFNLPLSKTPTIKKTAHCYNVMFSGPANYFVANNPQLNPQLAILRSNRLKQNMQNNISIDKKDNRYLKHKSELKNFMGYSTNLA
jgi:hypothetical protein